MIAWFGITIITLGIASALLCFVEALRKRTPNDFTMGATLLITLLLIAQIVISIVAPMTGNHAVGDPLEFWLYLIVAFALPIGAGFWALIDRTRWANVVLGVVHLAVAVMMYRMMIIWG